MTAFEKGFTDTLVKLAYSLPTIQYRTQEQQGEQDAEPMSFKDRLETAARSVLCMPKPGEQQAWNGYGVTTSHIGDKQVAPPYFQNNTETEKRVNRLQQKWDTVGAKPSTVGAARRVTTPGGTYAS